MTRALNPQEMTKRAPKTFAIGIFYGAFLFCASTIYGASLRNVSDGDLTRPNTAAVNQNFKNINDELSNTVHKTSTETIVGYKYFTKPVDFTTITADDETVTNLTVTSLTGTNATITNLTATGLTATNVTISSLTVSPGPISLSGLFTLSGVWDGWIGSTQTWSYISSTQFSVPGDVTGVYQKGDKIKLTQTTAKYFYVTAVAAGVTVTTITVTAGTDYTLANAAITSPYYSKSEAPQGHPTYFNYAPSYSASGSMTYTSVTTTIAKFSINGRQVFVWISFSGTTGGVASNNLIATLPVTPDNTSDVYRGAAVYTEGGDLIVGLYNISSAGINVRKFDSSAFGLGAGRSGVAAFSYIF